ncbi:hypothetical protein ACJ41O_002610 [Fusarium nematophilum]
MRLPGSRGLSTATLATFVFLFSSLILQSLATPTSDLAAQQEHGSLSRRAEQAGAACDTEGQWNCMTGSFQRCAAGQWSVEMAMADGTRCEPAGYTDDYNFRIEHDGSVNGQGNGDEDGNDGGNRGSSATPTGSVSGMSVIGVLGLWVMILGFVV